MIYTGSFKDISSNYDEVWLIVRSLKSMPNCNIPVYHVPALSPSPQLFKCYLNWRNQDLWNKNTFENFYKPRFLKEMEGEDAQRVLNLLINKASTKNILLVCFCNDESMCHRSLVYSLVPSALRGGTPDGVLVV